MTRRNVEEGVERRTHVQSSARAWNVISDVVCGKGRRATSTRLGTKAEVNEQASSPSHNCASFAERTEGKRRPELFRGGSKHVGQSCGRCQVYISQTSSREGTIGRMTSIPPTQEHRRCQLSTTYGHITACRLPAPAAVCSACDLYDDPNMAADLLRPSSSRAEFL